MTCEQFDVAGAFTNDRGDVFPAPPPPLDLVSFFPLLLSPFSLSQGRLRPPSSLPSCFSEFSGHLALSRPCSKSARKKGANFGDGRETERGERHEFSLSLVFLSLGLIFLFCRALAPA